MLCAMRGSKRTPLVAWAPAAALAAVGLPVLAAAAWRSFVWSTPGAPDAVRSLDGLTAVVAGLGLLVAGQLVALVQRRREGADALAARDSGALEAATERAPVGVGLGAVARAAGLVAVPALA